MWSDEGRLGMEYLCEDRKLSKEAIKQFGLGYVQLCANHELANRIIYPVYDASSNLIALSTRRISSCINNLPIHWHEQFEKSYYLYAMNIAKEHIRTLGYVIITEGQTDVIQCHNHGFYNTVGTLGVNLSELQLSIIKRYCRRIVLAYDSDENETGSKGMKDTTKMIDKYSTYCGTTRIRLFDVYKVSVPDQKDPDGFLKKYGAEPFRELINRALEQEAA